jgi:hypothetical protein
LHGSAQRCLFDDGEKVVLRRRGQHAEGIDHPLLRLRQIAHPRFAHQFPDGLAGERGDGVQVIQPDGIAALGLSQEIGHVLGRALHPLRQRHAVAVP